MEERYLMLEDIGNGAGGMVYKAFDKHLNRYVAVKKTDREKCSAFEEAEVLKRLKHPAIPIIYDVFQQEEHICMVMEYMTGKNLLSVLETGEPFEEGRAVEIGLRIGECLQYLHELPEKMIYRDLKPANLILDVGDKVKLIDFNSAFVKKDGQRQKQKTGTFGYSAPEQFEKDGIVDEKSDIYGFGTTMYHMLTGKNPSRPPYRFQKVRECNPLISEGLEKIVEKCMEKERAKRYTNMAEVLEELKTYDSKAKKKRRWSRKQKQYITEERKNILLTEKCGGGLFVLTVLLCGLLFLIQTNNGQENNVLPKRIYARNRQENVISEQAEEKGILPLVMYNKKKETILIKEGTFYKTDTDFHMEVPHTLFEGEKGAEITVIWKDLESGRSLEKVVLLKSK